MKEFLAISKASKVKRDLNPCPVISTTYNIRDINISVVSYRKATGDTISVLDRQMAHYSIIGVHLAIVGVVAIMCATVYTITIIVIFSVSVIEKVLHCYKDICNYLVKNYVIKLARILCSCIKLNCSL